MTSICEPARAGIELGVAGAGVREVGEHAILAVDIRVAEGLLGHRQDARRVLARGLRHELLEP